MLFLTVLLLFFIVCAGSSAGDEEHRAVCPDQPITAKESDDVSLRCCVDPPQDLSSTTLEWSRADVEIYSYQHEKERPSQNADYGSRTATSPADLRRGCPTLLLSSVKVTDSGRYRCFIMEPWCSCFVLLNVTIKQQEKPVGRVRLNTTGSPQNNTQQPHLSGDKITIIIVSVVLVVGFVVIGVLWRKRETIQKWWRRDKGQRRAQDVHSNELTTLNDQSVENGHSGSSCPNDDSD